MGGCKNVDNKGRFSGIRRPATACSWGMARVPPSRGCLGGFCFSFRFRKAFSAARFPNRTFRRGAQRAKKDLGERRLNRSNYAISPGCEISKVADAAKLPV